MIVNGRLVRRLMQLADLLSECYAAKFDESWEQKRTATPVRCSPSVSTQPVARFERYKQFSDLSA